MKPAQGPRSRTELRQERGERARALTEHQDGVVHRDDLRRIGVSRHHIRTEVAAGRWATIGNQTVVIPAAPLAMRARLRSIVWEFGRDAALDGVAALLVIGLANFDTDIVDVSTPHRIPPKRMTDVRQHRRRAMPKVIDSDIRRIHPAVALLNAASWAVTDRQAATIIAMTLQQRLVSAEHLMLAWGMVGRTRRRAFLDVVIKDACDGAHSLGELDFATLCRRYGLPAPERQVVRRTARGRIYLDVCWTAIGLVVEIDGGHHGLALQPVDDALRQNEVVISGNRVLRIPVVGLRLYEEQFMHQVVRAFAVLSARAA